MCVSHLVVHKNGLLAIRLHGERAFACVSAKAMCRRPTSQRQQSLLGFGFGDLSLEIGGNIGWCELEEAKEGG